MFFMPHSIAERYGLHVHLSLNISSYPSLGSKALQLVVSLIEEGIPYLSWPDDGPKAPEDDVSDSGVAHTYT